MIYQAAIDESFPVAESPTQVASLRSSDPAALAEAVGHYQHRLYRYFLRLVRDPASADDLFQQTWLHVVRQLHRYDSTRSFDTGCSPSHTMPRWICCGGVLPSVGRSRICAPPARATPQHRAGRERAAILAAAMAELPALYREASQPGFEEGMKLEEIAEVTRTSLSTVKSRVRRGLEAMKQKPAEDIV
jgi:RNA polymerase sigma-70 factor (ECF subfamily)